MNNFVKTIIKEIERVYPNARSIEIQKIQKQNGIELHGLLIKQNNENLVPNIYLESHYKDYQQGKSINLIVKDIISQYEEHRFSRQVDVSQLCNLELVKEKIFLKVLNSNLNEKYLNDVPSKEVGDLSLVTYIKLDSKENATVLIKNDLLKQFGINEYELFEIAVENSKEDFVFATMFEIMKTMIPELAEIESVPEEVPMYVLTNNSRMNGAFHIGIEETLNYIAEKLKTGFYILPSSVHEILIIPVGESIHDEGELELKNMIAEVNNTQVQEDEILSYNLYYYSKEFGLIIK